MFLFARKPNIRKLVQRKDVEGLIDALKHKDAEVRARAAEALGNTRRKRAIEPLVSALKDEHTDVRVQAARALGRIGDARAVEPLTQALGDEAVREAATEALGRIETKKTTKRKSTVKARVEKTVLFWLDRVPETRDAEAIADLLPQQMHRELVFEAPRALSEKISSKSVLKSMNELIAPVSARLAAAAVESGARIKKEEAAEIVQIRAMHIAVMQVILKRLQERHEFDHAESPNKLVCKFIQTTTGPCYYALILDSEIDPRKYEFATGPGGGTLSTILWEAANTPVQGQ